MKAITLNKQVIKNNNMTIEEVLYLALINYKADINKILDSLIDKGYITADRALFPCPIGWTITNKGCEILDTINIESDKGLDTKENLDDLAKQLKEIFPKGKKEGTNLYWAEGVALIIRRLKLFFKKYGTDFTPEQILTAAQKYKEGFNGDYRYMKTLKYFIFKEKVGMGGDIEGESELINYIENAGQEDELSNDWTNTLI